MKVEVGATPMVAKVFLSCVDNKGIGQRLAEGDQSMYDKSWCTGTEKLGEGN